jgi:molybdopterin-guanine dinucleotide biosynthesis protein A
VVVVRAPGQALPDLPTSIEVVEDPREGKGPVQGIAAGLAALRGRADVAFVCSTDMPFLHPAFVNRVLRALGDSDVALPVARGYRQPLAAAYRVSLADVAERLVAEERLRPAFLFDECAVAQLDDETLRKDPLLRALDPDLDSVMNINTPADYEAARARPAPEVTVDLSGAATHTIRAATLGAAADAVRLALDRRITATLNGDQITPDEQTPLATGDTVGLYLYA